MKIGGKRIPRGNLLIFLGMMTVSVCALLMSAGLRANFLNEMKSREFYSENSRRFGFLDCEDETFWEEVLASCPEEFILYCQVPDGEMDVRGVYAKGERLSPRMAWGRFFRESDQFQGTSCAVVGRDYEGALFREEDRVYFDYGGERFLVLGVMGYPWESRVDSMVYLDFSSGLSLSSGRGEYLLDGAGEEEIQACLDHFQKETWRYGQMAVSAADEPKSLWDRYLKGSFGAVFYALIYLSFFLSVVIMANMWVGYRGCTLSILQMLGLTRGETAWEVGKSFFFLSLGSWAFGSTGVLIAARFLPLLTFGWLDFLISFAAAIVTGMLALVFPLSRRIRAELGLGMR